MQKSKYFQRKIVELSNESEVEHQIIFITSMIDVLESFIMKKIKH